MATPEIESKWYEALFEEDCPRVMRLLKDHPSLLKQGWESEPSRIVEGSKLNFWEPRTRSPWRGRTALHVGARRGSAELVAQVLRHCYVGDLGDPVQKDGDDGRSHNISSPLHKELLASEDSRRKRRKDRQAGRKTGCSTVVEIGGTPAVTPSAVVHPELHADGDTEMLQLTEVCSTRQVDDGWEAERRLHFMEMENYSNLSVNAAEVSVSLEDLLYLKDGEYQLDAIALAALHANFDVVSLLLNPKSNRLQCGILGDYMGQNDTDERAQIRKITEEVIESLLNDPDFSTSTRKILEAYTKHRDFNFLPRELYLFHFLFAKGLRNDNSRLQAKLKLIRVYLWEKLRSSTTPSGSLSQFVLRLQDGQGRTPAHVAVDEETVEALGELLEGDVAEEAYMSAMITSDAAGRSALHRAVALGRMDAIKSMRSILSENQQFKDMLTLPWQHSLGEVYLSKRDRRFREGPIDIDGISRRNGFGGRRSSFRNHIEGRVQNNCSPCTPLHSAIIHKRTEFLRVEFAKFSEKDRTFPWITDVSISDDKRSKINEYIEELDSMELASLVGEVSTVRRLLEEGFQQQPWSLEEECPPHLKIFWPKGKYRWPTILLAANSGNYELLKCFIDCPHYDTYIVDTKGDTALHHALTSTEITFKMNLLDFINCEHICSTDPRISEEEVRESDRHSLVERQGCINLLLRAGCDIFKPNKDGQAPYPRGQLVNNESFLSWWYEKEGKEFKITQTNMSYFANATSVIATLVATVSYLGPLQPPGGYVGSPSQMQVGNIWVKVFIVCDTLSFYLAIAAITFSLIPSLPMPQQEMTDELRRTRTMVTLAVSILFPSIICVFLAFASSTMAVIRASKILSIGEILLIATTSVGGLICIGGFILFFIRLLGFVYPRNKFVRYLYITISF